MTLALLGSPSRARRSQRRCLASPSKASQQPDVVVVSSARGSLAPRLELIRRVRSQISLGQYETGSRLDVAVSRMIDCISHSP